MSRCSTANVEVASVEEGQENEKMKLEAVIDRVEWKRLSWRQAVESDESEKRLSVGETQATETPEK